MALLQSGALAVRIVLASYLVRGASTTGNHATAATVRPRWPSKGTARCHPPARPWTRSRASQGRRAASLPHVTTSAPGRRQERIILPWYELPW